MIREIISELWYVFILSVIILYGLVFMDISSRLSMNDYCKNWEYNIDCPAPNGFEKAMFQEPEYKPKHRVYKP